jgi:serine/threonine protein kinase
MGVVYRMRHIRLDRVDAVKLIAPQHAEDPDFRARFERESRVAAGLEHPHVVQIYHAGEENGSLYLAMRYVHGTDLRAELKRYRRLGVQRAVEIVRQVASALDAAHRIGLVHRDVKPANVLLSRRNGHDHAFLTDFGLTKDLSSRGRETRTGAMVGTTGYIAPEQVKGAPLTPRADIYALGCVLYHLLSGHVPYPREMELAAAVAHVNEPVPSLSDASEELALRFDPVVRIAMAKDPADRFATAGSLAEAARIAAGLAPAMGASESSPTLLVTGPPGAVEPQNGAPASDETELTMLPPPAGRAAPSSAPSAERDPTLLVKTTVGRSDGLQDPSRQDGRPPRRSRRWVRWALVALLGAAIAAGVVVLILRPHHQPVSRPPGRGPRWRTLPGLPVPLEDVGVAAYKGAVWVVGGQTGSAAKPDNRVWIYRPGAAKWRPGPALPVHLDDPAVVANNHSLYVLGGWTGKRTSDQTWVLNKPNGDWSRYIPLPDPRSAGAAAWDGTRIVFGGGDYKGEQSNVWAVQGKRWIRIGLLARPREHLTAAANTTYESVWFIGGTDQKGDVSYPDVDIAAGYVVRPGQPVPPINGAAAVPVGSGFCVLGGYRNGFVLGQVYCRDAGIGLPPFSPGRSKLGATILDGTIYAIGGHTADAVVGTKTVQAIKVP